MLQHRRGAGVVEVDHGPGWGAREREQEALEKRTTTPASSSAEPGALRPSDAHAGQPCQGIRLESSISSKVALLFSNCYASVDLDHSVVRYVRNSVPFPSTEQLLKSHGDVARVLDRLGRARYALLVDLRQAGAASEYAMANERRRLLFGFARTAIVVKNAISAREVRRHADEHEIDVRVFVDDDRAALAYAQSGGPVSNAFSSGIIEASSTSSSITTLGTGRRRTRG